MPISQCKISSGDHVPAMSLLGEEVLIMGIFDFLKGKPKAYHHVFDATDRNFDVQVLQRSYKQLIIVDYWAAWCVPCRKLGPVFERIAFEPDAPFLLAKLDTERNQKTARRFNIQSIPAVKFFRNGQVVGEFQGLQLEARIRSFIEAILEKPAPPPRIKISGDPAKRLGQAKTYLRKGRGFQATIFLRDFPDSAQAEEAAALLPLSQYLWDIEDGDAHSGTARVDDLMEDFFAAFRQGKTKQAREPLTSAIAEADGETVTELKAVMAGLERFTNRS